MRRVLSILLVGVMLLSLVACKGKIDDQVNSQVEILGKIDVISAVASTDDGNVAENTIDNYSDTRWSGEGDGASITYDLGKEENLAYIGIAFYQGDVRYTNFEIAVSSDNETFTQVYAGSNQEEPGIEMVKFDIEDTQARFVRIIGHGYEYFDGSKSGLWNSIVEVHFYNDDSLAMLPMIVSEMPIDITYDQVGLINADGSEHSIHIKNLVTGNSLSILDYDVDLTVTDFDDSVAIQQAIADASEGDEVFLPAGIYDIYNTIYLKSGINLRGESGTILRAKETNGNSLDSLLEARGIHDLLISDLTLTSDFSGDFSSDHNYNNPDAAGPKYMVRIIDDGSNIPSYNITVENLYIEKFQTMGVRIANSHDVVVQNTTFQNATDLGGGGAGYGISIQGEGNNINRIGYSNDTRFNVVRDCTFTGPYLRHGILLQYYAHNNLIENNTLLQTKLDAIDLHGEDEYLNEIRFNTIQDIEAGAGIGVGNSGATHDAAGAGNYIHDNTIVNAREGIKVHLGSPDTLIENNTITGASITNAKGIYLQNAPGTIVRGNVIEDNHGLNFWSITLNGDGGTDGRGQGDPEDIIIEGNTFKNVSGGINISRGSDILFHQNTYEEIETMEILDTRDYSYVAELLPSQVLDLVNWKINLPLENAKEIRQPELKTFEDELYFYVNDLQDGIVFKAPCQADTTQNSSYPRSELREMAYGGMAQASWSTDNGTHIMVIDQMITHTPEVKPHVVVGQIHDADDDVVMIRLEGNYLYVEAEGVDVGVLDADYTLGERFKIKIKAFNDNIEVYYNDELMVSYDVHKEGCYFKAGMYTQSNTEKGDAPDAYGEVIIYDLQVTHSGIAEEAQTYDNVDIPNTESIGSIMPSMDTYIDIMKVDGLMTANVQPRGEEEKLMVKTSSGQTTIRLAFYEFDLSAFSGDPYAATLNVTTMDSNGSSLVSVYGFEQVFDENLVWGDLFSEDARISASNTEVMDYLRFFGQKTGEGEIGYKDPDVAVQDQDHYSINVSDFISNTEADLITLVMVEEIGVNINLQIYASESQASYAPYLEIWSEDGGMIQEVEVELEPTEDPVDQAIEAQPEDENIINLDAEYVNEALDLLTYDIFEIIDGRIVLPDMIGEDVSVEWVISDESLLGMDGSVHISDMPTDITVTAILRKNIEETQKEFILVIQ